MEIKHHNTGYINVTGSSLLRQLQNDHTPVLDLFIRESVQNSLDAAATKKEPVVVSLTTGMFQTSQLSPYFEGITDRMNSLYPGEQEYLSIQDTGTTGLTGPISLKDVENNHFGNLQKLIYQVMKPQEKEGSGGSWGLGKTVYFRVGKGLVIYYSRIRKTDSQGSLIGYEERLAASVIEDEKKPRFLKDSVNKTGIAWWGTKDPKMLDEDGTIPLVDDPEIYEILKVFDQTPMTGDETGTRIIIPFTNDRFLLEQTYTASESNSETSVPYWKRDIDDFLTVGLQKWYCPRLDNSNYDGPKLVAFVKGNEIQKDDFLPLFALIQDLYNQQNSFKGRKIHSESITLRNNFDPPTPAGILSFVKVDEKNLEMTRPDFLPGPYTCIDRDDIQEHEPILAYCRKPGMIVSYETNSDWTHSMPVTEENVYIVGMFRSSSTAMLKQEFRTEEVKSLEDYLRKGEAADHLGWTDITLNAKRADIIRKVKVNVRNKIKNRFSEQQPREESKRNPGLGRKIGQMFLPPEGSDYWDRRIGGIGNGGGSGGHPRLTPPGNNPPSSGFRTGFDMKLNGEPQYLKDEVRVPVLLSFGKETNGQLSILVKTETGNFDPAKWKDRIGTLFPAKINYLELLDIDKEKSETGNSGGKKKRKKQPKKEPLDITVFQNSTVQGIEFTFSGDFSSGGTGLKIQMPAAENYKLNAVISYSIKGFEGVLDFSRMKKIEKEGKSE